MKAMFSPRCCSALIFPFLAPLQLVQSELRDHGAVFLVQRLPDRRTGGLFGDGVFVAGRIGCP